MNLTRVSIFSFLIAGFLTIATCENAGNPIDATNSLNRERIQLTVYTYKNAHEVTEVFASLHPDNPPKYQREGFAIWQTNNGEHICVVHVPEIRTVDDQRMETWGHELAHCVYGSFHPEPVE